MMCVNFFFFLTCLLHIFLFQVPSFAVWVPSVSGNAELDVSLKNSTENILLDNPGLGRCAAFFSGKTMMGQPWLVKMHWRIFSMFSEVQWFCPNWGRTMFQWSTPNPFRKMRNLSLERSPKNDGEVRRWIMPCLLRSGPANGPWALKWVLNVFRPGHWWKTHGQFFYAV